MLPKLLARIGSLIYGEPIGHSAGARVRCGSKSEILAKSKCLPLCHQHQTFVRKRCFTIESAMAGSIYLRLCAPSVPVSDNEFRDLERLGQADGFAPEGLQARN